MLPNYYSILRIPADASAEEIRTAYRRMARQHQPDAGGRSEDLQAVQQAYDVLSDPARRRQYDAEQASHVRRAVVVERPIPPEALIRSEPLIPAEPLRPARILPSHSPGPLEEFDRLFREFDEFFERLEEQFWNPSWGRNE